MTKLWQGMCSQAFGLLLIVGLTGCIAPPFNIGKQADPPTPADSFVLVGYQSKGDSKDPAERKKRDEDAYDQLKQAKKLKDENDLVNAEKIFKKLADNVKNPLAVIEEARYLEADCQWLRDDKRSAAATYKRQIKDVRDGEFTQLALGRLYEIADGWLDDTRKQMEDYEKQRANKSWFVAPMPMVHWDRKKPFLDEEGTAITCLETIVENDRDNKLREKALFLLANVRFFRADYSAADDYYTELWRKHKNSPLAARACKQSIVCKMQVNGGTVYNPKTIEEARKTMEEGKVLFPELARDEEWLDQHAKAIYLMQADRDWNVAEFYRRKSKPGAAYFYYELIRRRYPGTNYATKAEERIAEVRGQVEKAQEAQRKEEAKLAERSAQTDTPIQQASWWTRILPWQNKKDDTTPKD